MTGPTLADLNARSREILRLIVDSYVETGEPVGSRTLSRRLEQQLSPATIRNVMADLDEMGFVCSPHTSAGRIPTQQGYRLFVDQLLEPEHMPARVQRRLMQEILGSRAAGSDEMLQATSHVLSSLSTMAGVVTVPRRNRAVLRRIEFLPLSGQRVLAILVVNQHEVQNRVLQTERTYAAEELERFANAINTHFAGRDLLALREALRQDLGETKQSVDAQLQSALELLESAAPEKRDDGDMVVAGGANLFAFE